MKPKISKTHLFYAGAIFLCMFLGMGNMLGFGKEAFMIVLGVTTVALSFFYPSAPLFIFVLGVPLESKTEFLNLGQGFNFTNIILILMLFGWVMRVVIKKERMLIDNPLNRPIMFYLLIALFSFVYGSFRWEYELDGDVLTAFKQSMTFFVIFYFAANCIRTDRERKILLLLVSLMVFYEGTVAIRQHHDVSHIVFEDESRVTGTFGSEKGGVVGANELGAFFAQYAPIFLAGIFIIRPFLAKAGYAALYGVCVVSAMYTFSRAAYLSMILSAMVMFLNKSRKSIFLFMVLGMIVFASAPGAVRERFTSIRYDDKSTEVRKEIWADTRYYIIRSPLFGYGFSASSYMLSRDTHNMYYDIALEMGIPQVLILLLILWRIFKISDGLKKLNGISSFERQLCIATMGAVVALAFGNIFGTRLNFFSINAYFMMMAGVVARLYMEKTVAQVTS